MVRVSTTLVLLALGVSHTAAFAPTKPVHQSVSRCFAEAEDGADLPPIPGKFK